MAETINNVDMDALNSKLVSGRDILLFLNIATEAAPVWSPVVCLSANGINKAANVIDTANKCGRSKTSGDLDFTVDFTGNSLLGNYEGAISERDLDYLLKKGLTKQWMQGRAIPEAGDERDVFYGFVSQDNITNPTDGHQEYSCAIAISGTPVKEIATAGALPADPLVWTEYTPDWD